MNVVLKDVICKVMLGKTAVMLGRDPKINTDLETITFPQIAVSHCFKEDYLVENFDIVIERDSDPIGTTLTCSITEYGLLTLVIVDNKRFVMIKDVEFSYQEYLEFKKE